MSACFEGQREDEEVLLVFRRKGLVMWKGVLIALLVWLLGVVPLFFWQTETVIIWALICVVAGGLVFLRTYLLWHFSYYLLTNERLRQVKQKGMFRHSVVDLALERILSVSYGVPGIMGSLLNYGTILIQTGAGDLTLSKVSQPARIHARLQNAIHEAVEDNRGGEDENGDEF